MTRIWTRLCDRVLSVAAGDRSQLSAFQQGDADLAAQTRLFPARRTSSSCTHNARFEAHSHVRGTSRERKGAGVRAQVRHSAPRWPHAGCESQSRVGPEPAACTCILTCWWRSSRTGTRCPCTSCAGGYAAIITKVQGRALNPIGLWLNCRARNSLCGDRTLSFVTALLSREKASWSGEQNHVSKHGSGE